MPDTRPIGLFDSGVGGLSILKEIQAQLPKENTIFLADQINMPYGKKTSKELKKICTKITFFLVKNNIKMLIVACNTATCYTLDHLRKNFKVPIIGVVPAIKPATKITRNGKIAVMATPATVKSQYLKNLIKVFAKGNKVLKIPCFGLEDSIEKLDEKKLNYLLEKYSKKILNFNADVTVLGCTHYPLVRKKIESRLNNKAQVMDSGGAIAKRVKDILKKTNSFSDIKTQEIFYTTGSAKEFSKISSKLLLKNINAQKIII